MGSSLSTTPHDEGQVHYYPRHSDAIETFNILRQRLPSELVLEIMDFAQYGLLSRINRDDNETYEEHRSRDGSPYLRSDPIEGKRFPVREIRISILSHDQGWSSYAEDHGTYRNSWTWFELGIERPSGRDDISKGEDLRLATNVHAKREATLHQIVFQRDQDLRWLQRLEPGDRVSIIPRARFPGWRNVVNEASIEIYTFPAL
jgi:hypothetical protein